MSMLIDPFVGDWLVPVEGSAPLTNASLYLLLDGVCDPGLYRKVQRLMERPEDVQLLFDRLPGSNDETRDVSPFVVPCSATMPRLRPLLRRCEGMPMVHALCTPESPAELASRLADWCVVETDGQRFNLRFTDTRRLAGIYAALTPQQQGAFFGKTLRWSYVGRDGHWATLKPPEPPKPPEPREEPEEPEEPKQAVVAPPNSKEPRLANSPLVLTAAQFAQMLDDGEADALMLVLRDRGAIADGTLPSTAHDTIAAALELARAARLDPTITTDWCQACLRDDALLSRAAGGRHALEEWQQRALA